jgi:hypothetical protein
MRSIPSATPITLSDEERAELEGWAGSTKSEHRMRQRARIVLLAAAGAATREIGRRVGCTTGTASKWRVRYLKLANGRSITGQSHDYKRHGTTTLFAAFEVRTGKVIGRHYKRRRRVEFLDFMNHVIADDPEREIHVVLDNLSTHKPKRDMWLARHKNVTFHYTPTHASWLNQVEIWFSILSGLSLKGASFTGVPQLIQHISDFIDTYNKDAKPFLWTKSKVHQKRLKPCFNDQ